MTNSVKCCMITKHQCGTDTWSSGTPCTCANCTEYLFNQQPQIVKDIVNGQQPLEPMFSKVLYDNLWNMYEK